MLEIRSCCGVLATLICILLTISQTDAGAETKHDEKYPPLPAPWGVDEAFAPFGQTLTPSQAIIHWWGPKAATGYIVTIFIAENKELILHEEIGNIHKTNAKFTDLESSTKYEVVVQTVRVHPDGTQQKSNYSEPYGFKTLDSCTGGRVHSPCTSSCIKTCARQVISCDRRCVSACGCPRQIPLWHNGECLNKQQCRTAGTLVSEVLGRPQNLKIHRAKKSKGVLFQWDEVEGADFYTVIVSLRNGTVVKSVDTKVPFVLITNLKSKIPYRFKVQAKWRREVERRLGFGPRLDPPLVSLVDDTSVHVEWEKWEGVERYRIHLKDGESNELIQSFRKLNISNNFVTIEGLDPQTVYHIIVLIKLANGFALETGPAAVKTKGIKNETEQDNVVEYTVDPVIVTTTTAPTTKPLIATFTCVERKRALEAYHKSNANAESDMPACDTKGNYRARQCEKSGCYCVKVETGEKRPGSEFKSPSSEFALDCGNYGKFKIPALTVTASATDTQTMKIRWKKNPACKFYIVKIHDGFEEGIITYKSGLTKYSTVISGLERGKAYIVTVAGVSSKGWTSTDKVRGQFVVMPHLDPPTWVRLAPVAEDRMKVMWTKSSLAKYYKVEVFKQGNDTVLQTYENITANFLVFPVEGTDPYKVRVSSTGTKPIPGIDKVLPVSSNGVVIARKPTCVPPPLDVIFVLDVTTKVLPEDFAKMKTFFDKLARGLTPIAKDRNEKIGSRIAAVKSYDLSRQIFRYNRFNSISNLVSGLKFVRQSKSNRLRIGEALNYIHRNFFLAQNNDDQRKNVQTLVVTFFGSKSNDQGFGGIASRLRAITKVISVGVKNVVSGYDMSMVSSDGMDVLIPNYDEIDMAFDKVMKLICKLKK